MTGRKARSDGPFAFPANFTSIPAVEHLGEEFGPGGMCVLVGLMCQAGTGNTGRAAGDIRELSEVARVPWHTTVAVITSLVRLGLATKSAMEGDRFAVHLSGVLSRYPRRPSLSRRLRNAVLARDGRICGICGRRIAEDDELHIDHIRPFSRGGSDTIDNLQAAHGTCNRKKAASV